MQQAYFRVLADGRVFDLRDDKLVPAGSSVSVGMGQVMVRRTRAGKTQLVRVTSTGREAFAVTVNRPGTWAVNPNYGFRVKFASEERDPIKRVLREEGVPMRHLTIGDPNGRADESDRYTVLSDGESEYDRATENFVIQGATVRLTKIYGCQMNGLGYCRPVDIMVTPGADPEVVRALIREASGMVPYSWLPVSVRR